jgi:hypothetical protein
MEEGEETMRTSLSMGGTDTRARRGFSPTVPINRASRRGKLCGFSVMWT